MQNLKEIKMITKEFIPTYETTGSVGFDLRAYIPEKRPLRVPAGKTVLISTGIQMEIPEGYEVQIRPRSGLDLKFSVGASLGTIDSDFRANIGIIFRNYSRKSFYIKHGDRLAQGVLSPITKAVFTVTEELSETERGEGGFGSTGVS